MPSAYTAILGETEDLKLKDFAMLCARNFGACIEMCDTPLSEPIPEKFEPSPFYKDRLEKAKKEYADFMALSESEKYAYLERTFKEIFEKDCKRQEEINKSKEILRKRYNAMLLKVVNWTPPTSEHIGLKEFMTQQILDSLKWDCSNYTPIFLKKDEWCNIDNYVDNKKREINYYQKSYDEELARYASLNKWLDDLRNSFEE